MKSKLKKSLSLLLALVMCLSCMSVGAMADDDIIDTAGELTAAVEAGGTVKLGGDVTLTASIEVSKNVTIDLNGQTLTGGYNMFYVTSGKLTIQDTSEGASGVYTSSAGNGDYSVAPSGYKGAITLRGGSFELKSGTVNGSYYAVRTATGSGTITVSGGTLTGMYPIYDGQGTYNIGVTGGKVTTSYPNGSAIHKTTAGSVTISGGEIEALGNSTINTSCVKCGQYGSGSASLTISGGTFNAPYGCLIEMGTGTLTVTNINVTKVGYAPFYNCDKINAASRVSAGDYTSAGYRPTLKAGTLNGGSFRKNDAAYIIDYLVDGYEVYVDDYAVVLKDAPEGYDAVADYEGKAFFLRDADVTSFFSNRDPYNNPHQAVTIYKDADFDISKIQTRLGDTMTVSVKEGATYIGTVTFDGKPYHPEMYLDVVGPTSEGGFTTTVYTLKEHPYVTLYADGNRKSEGVSYGTVKSAINAIASNNTSALIVAEEGIAYLSAVLDGNNRSFTYDLNGQEITGSAYNVFLSPRGSNSVVNVIDSVGTAAVNSTYNYSGSGLIGDNNKSGTLNVHGGSYTANVVISIGQYYAPVFNIDGGTYSGKVNMSNGTLNISGGSVFNGAFTLSNSAAVSITGGYFDEAAYNSLKGSANVTLPEGKALVKATGEYAQYYTVGVAKNYVAEIEGGDQYETLQDAIDAAQDGNIIKLLSDIALDKDVQILCTGENVYSVENENGQYAWQRATNPLTSLTIDGQGHKITMAENPTFGGKYTLSGDVPFFFGVHGDSAHLANSYNVNSGSYTLKNITFSGFDRTIMVAVRCTLNIEDCTFTENTIAESVKSSNPNRNLVYSNEANLNVSGSTFANNTAGALLFGGSNVSITNNKFDTNTANDAGGVVFVTRNVSANERVISNNTFEQNTVSASGNVAVAYIHYKGATVTGNLFKSNRVTSTGNNKTGVVYINDDDVEATYSTTVTGNAFDNNIVTASTAGAGTVFVRSNCNLSNNYWGNGAAAEIGSGRDIFVKDGIVTNTNYATAYAANSNGRGCTVTLAEPDTFVGYDDAAIENQFTGDNAAVEVTPTQEAIDSGEANTNTTYVAYKDANQNVVKTSLTVNVVSATNTQSAQANVVNSDVATALVNAANTVDNKPSKSEVKVADLVKAKTLTGSNNEIKLGMSLTLTEQTSDRVTFDIHPTVQVNNGDVETLANGYIATSGMTVKMPVPSTWTSVKVYHGETLVGTYTPVKENSVSYVEFKGTSFSEYSGKDNSANAFEAKITSLQGFFGDINYMTIKLKYGNEEQLPEGYSVKLWLEGGNADGSDRELPENSGTDWYTYDYTTYSASYSGGAYLFKVKLYAKYLDAKIYVQVLNADNEAVNVRSYPVNSEYTVSNYMGYSMLDYIGIMKALYPNDTRYSTLYSAMDSYSDAVKLFNY